MVVHIRHTVDKQPDQQCHCLLLYKLFCNCPVGVSKLLQQRRFQAGLKVWLALSIALMVIILLSVWQPTLPSNLISECEMCIMALT